MWYNEYMKALPPDIATNIAENPPDTRGKGGIAAMVRSKTANGQTIIDYLFGVMESDKIGTANKLQAVKLLLERGWGQPQQNIEIHQTSEVSQLSSEQLRGLAYLIRHPDQLEDIEAEYREVATLDTSSATLLNSGPANEGNQGADTEVAEGAAGLR